MNLRTTRFLTILLASGGLAVLAGTASAASWRPRLGLEGGVNGGRLAADSRLGNGAHWKLGGSAGLLTRWSLAPGWSLEAAPGWERQIRRGNGTFSFVGPASYDQSVRFDRAVFPVRTAFHPGASGWSLEAGIAAAWLASARRTGVTQLNAVALTAPGAPAPPRTEPTANIFEDVGTFGSATDWTNQFHRWDATVAAGAGWDRPFGGRVLRARARWQQGLTNLSKEGEPLRLSSVSATVGVLW